MNAGLRSRFELVTTEGHGGHGEEMGCTLERGARVEIRVGGVGPHRAVPRLTGDRSDVREDQGSGPDSVTAERAVTDPTTDLTPALPASTDEQEIG